MSNIFQFLDFTLEKPKIRDMKKKLLFFTLFLFTIACKKDTSETQKHEVTSTVTVQEAKEFLNNLSELKTNSQNESSFNAKSLLEKIDWKKASNFKNGKILIGKFEGCPAVDNIKIGFRKAVFYKDANGKITMNILEFIPEFYHLWNYKAINSKLFDGKIMIYDQNYKLDHGYNFERGKIVGQIMPSKELNLQQTTSIKNNVSITSCSSTTYTYLNAQGTYEASIILSCRTIYYFILGKSIELETGEEAGLIVGAGDGEIIPVASPISDIDISEAVPVVDGKPAVDPLKFKNCFDDGKNASSYKLTIYVDQPITDSNDQWAISSTFGQRFKTSNGVSFDVGHAFVGFKKINTDGTSVTQVLGFYPSDASTNVKGVIKNDGGHSYDISYSSEVNSTKFEIALNSVISDNVNKNYVLSN